MTERQAEIAERQKKMYLRSWIKRLEGVEVLEIYEANTPIALCTLYEAYLSTYQIENGSLPYCKLPFSSSKSEIYAWILQKMDIQDGQEVFLYYRQWMKIRIEDAALAVASLWEASGGFLLASVDCRQILEVGTDSRDEENYLLDIWKPGKYF